MPRDTLPAPCFVQLSHGCASLFCASFLFGIREKRAADGHGDSLRCHILLFMICFVCMHTITSVALYAPPTCPHTESAFPGKFLHCFAYIGRGGDSMELMYLRKSRADGEHESVGEVLQRHESILQAFAEKEYGHRIAEEHIFREIVSGETIQARPAMCRLLERIQEQNVDAVLVVDPQRLTRGDLRDCGTIIRAFQYTGTIVATPQKAYDLRDKFDRKFLEMELMRGNDYLEYVKEIMLRGRLASVSEGNYIGSGAPFGYDKIRTGKNYTLAENAESDAVRLIFALYVDQGLGYAEICKQLDARGIRPRRKSYWVPSSIREILHNPVYIGKIRWNQRKTVKQYRDGEIVKSRPRTGEDAWILTDGKHPPLVTQEQFRLAQERCSAPRAQLRKPLCNPLAGLCRCECGAAMVLKSCRNARPRILCTQQQHCRNRSAVYAAYLAVVTDCLRRTLPPVETVYSAAEDPYRQLEKQLQANLQSELAEIEKQQEILYGLLERGIYSEQIFLQRSALLSERRKNAEEALQRTEDAGSRQSAISAHCITTSEILDAMECDVLTPQQKNSFLKTVIEEIVYTASREQGREEPFRLCIRLRY